NAVHFDLYRGNRHVYGIFFATQSWLGTDKMKAAIWKINPDGTFKIRGGQDTELDLATPNFAPLAAAIEQHFANKWVTPAEIAQYVGSDATDYHSGQFKRN